MERVRLIALAASVLCTSCFLPSPKVPVRLAAAQGLPAVDSTRALVVFVWPPCESYEDEEDASVESTFMCKRAAMNRIRVVEEGARLVTDIDLGEYGASYEMPGKHRYGAFHWSDSCGGHLGHDQGAFACVAALEADLQPGRTYFVTFRWTFLRRSMGKHRTVYGRLDLVPIAVPDEAWFRGRLALLQRVEPIVPDATSTTNPREIRNVTIASHIRDRLREDSEANRTIPQLQ